MLPTSSGIPVTKNGMPRQMLAIVKKSPVYGNHKVYSPAMEFMFRSSLGRCEWYVDKGLATEITLTTESTSKKEEGEEEPAGVRSFQLLFDPKDKGHAWGREGDAYFLEYKSNRCVVCGFVPTFDSENDVNGEVEEIKKPKETPSMSGGETKDSQDGNEDTMSTAKQFSWFRGRKKFEIPNGIVTYHIVPVCYRKWMPLAMKDNNNHDVLPLCLNCMRKCNGPATIRTKEFSEKFGAPLKGTGMVTSKENVEKKYIARTILSIRNFNGPRDRLLQFEGRLREAYGLSEEDDITEILETAAKLPVRWKGDGFKEHGQLVVEALSEEGLRDFVIQWRKGFVETMKPRFLSENWSVDDPTRYDIIRCGVCADASELRR